MHLDIRQATLQDLQAVHMLDRQAYATDFYPRFVLRQLYDTQRRHFKVALLDAVVVGFVIGSAESDSSTGWILAIAADSNHRNQGIATQLMQAAIDDFRQQGIRSVQLTVAEDNAQARKLYEQKFSFVLAGRVDDYYGDGHPRLRLSLDLE
jgi:ribosomal protein S18 acetylase RimI-like enzyme